MTESDLDSFQAGYRGSEEERGDVLKYYQQFKGDMGKVRQGGEGWWTVVRGAGHVQSSWLGLHGLPGLIGERRAGRGPCQGPCVPAQQQQPSGARNAC